MVLNYIWIAFFVIAFVMALGRLLFLGDTEIFTSLVNATFDSSKNAFEISLGLTGILALWLGVMKIGEQSGMINALPRHSQRTSRYGKHFHELLRQYVGTG